MKLHVNTETLNNFKSGNDLQHELFANDVLNTLQDRLENTFVTYSKEDVADCAFLTLVAEFYPEEVTVSDVKHMPVYTFELHYKEKPALECIVYLTLNQAHTKILVRDIDVLVL